MCRKACEQEESFKVLSGKMGYFWENETGTAEVGEVLTIPPGIKHTFFSADPEQPLEFEVTLKPAVRVTYVWMAHVWMFRSACSSWYLTRCMSSSMT